MHPLFLCVFVVRLLVVLCGDCAHAAFFVFVGRGGWASLGLFPLISQEGPQFVKAPCSARAMEPWGLICGLDRRTGLAQRGIASGRRCDGKSRKVKVD